MTAVKKRLSVLWYILFVLHCALPAGLLVRALTGYTVTPRSPVILAVICAAVSVIGAGIALLPGETDLGIPGRIVTACLPLVTVIHWVILPFFTDNMDEGGKSAVIFISMMICLGCAMGITAKAALPGLLKAAILTLAALAIVPLAPYWTFIHVIGGLAHNTVVETVPSPAGTYYAEIIDSDQGALGGDTFVDVYESRSFDTLLFRIRKKPRRLYTGPWGEYQWLEVYWKNDGCLVIGATEYQME